MTATAAAVPAATAAAGNAVTTGAANGFFSPVFGRTVEMRGQTVVAGLVALVVVGSVVPGAGATQPTSGESFVVELSSDGSATVTVTSTFDLTDENESDAFAELRNDSTAREQFRTRFRDRMRAVAADAENATGREMSITDANLAFRVEGETGIVEQSVTWQGLAGVEDDELVVTEPFASGFEPDRTFRVVVPDGYDLAASPMPDDIGSGSATWEPGTSLDGFEVTATAPATDTPAATTTVTTMATPTNGTTSGSGAGFGAGAAALALLAAAALVARHQ